MTLSEFWKIMQILPKQITKSSYVEKYFHDWQITMCSKILWKTLCMQTMKNVKISCLQKMKIVWFYQGWNSYIQAVITLEEKRQKVFLFTVGYTKIKSCHFLSLLYSGLGNCISGHFNPTNVQHRYSSTMRQSSCLLCASSLKLLLLKWSHLKCHACI